MSSPALSDVKGLIFDLDTFAVHDGPGIRMAVYLKGCQLGCKWCHSPESISPEPELVFVRDRCARCGECAAVCVRGVHTVDASGHTLDRTDCVVCGQCVASCPTGALALKGEAVFALQLVERAARMKPFFDHSGGGITLTGGEVTCQLDFARSVLAGCKARGIHTAIETNGACPWEDLAQLLPYSDLVLYDLKLIDDAEHRRWTGASNHEVLENAAKLKGHNIQIRVPLIPGITDTDDNVAAIFAFMRRVGLSQVSLLPYNASAAAKYEWLDVPYEIDLAAQNCLPRRHEQTPAPPHQPAASQSPERLRALLAMARAAGLEAALS